MKLAEALLERKSLKEKIQALRSRLDANVLVQEGDEPVEQPKALIAELDQSVDQLEALIRRINATNNTAQLEDGTSVSDAIVRRDMLRLRREAMEQVAESASMRQHRWGRNEVKFVATLNSAELRQQVDALSKHDVPGVWWILHATRRRSKLRFDSWQGHLTHDAGARWYGGCLQSSIKWVRFPPASLTSRRQTAFTRRLAAQQAGSLALHGRRRTRYRIRGSTGCVPRTGSEPAVSTSVSSVGRAPD